MTAIPPLKWEARKRLEAIERHLWWTGRLGRGDLVAQFGISTQQASADIARYQDVAPGNAVFDGSRRTYVATPDMRCRLIEPTAEDYRRWQPVEGVGVVGIDLPLRPLPAEALQPVTRAIHQRQSIEVTYQSMSSEAPTTRWITPHSIVYDGYRYHARAWCHRREDFRDFVIGRVTHTGGVGDPGPGIDRDEAWHTRIALRLGPHPGLTPAQRAIIEREYGMKNGELQLRVREALLHYTLTQLHLDRFTRERTPAEQQIILLEGSDLVSDLVTY
jgi:predicted DNA-binding transcriptional regulator YafY